MPPTLLRKAEFARAVNRSPGRVTQWITEGKLSGPAIVQTSDGERIDLAIARQQLGITLDVSQQVALATPIFAPVAAELPLDDDDIPLGGPAVPVTVAQPVNLDQSRLLRAKADSAETGAERERLDLMAQTGQWVRKSEVQAQWQRGMAALRARIDGEAQTIGELFAEEFGLDRKKSVFAARRAMRAIYAKLSSDAESRRTALVEVIDEEQGDQAA